MKLRWVFSVALAVVLGGLVAQIAPARADTYGAIAYSEQNGANAWSVDQASAEGANLRALSFCTKKSDGCKVVASFSNSCAALAVGVNKRFAASQAGTSQQAQSDALDACRSKGGTRCDVKVAFCANPPSLNAKPGLWKLINQDVSDGQIQPAFTGTRCIKPKPEDIVADNWVFLLDAAASDATCHQTGIHTSSNSIEWKFVCSGQDPRTREGSVKFDTPGHFTGTVSTKGGKVMGNLPLGRVLHTDGKWVGPCIGGAN
jgi:Domain of unknown function (DUF4189)/Protein of unknown function (DUF3617)